MPTIKPTRRYYILIGAFLVATALWFSVTMRNSFRVRVDVPLSVINIPVDIALAKPLPETISVLVEASGWQLLFLNAGKPITFEIPGEALRRGEILTNKVLGEMMKMPAGIQAIRAYPDTIFVSIDKFTEKTVPIHATAIAMTFKDGFGLVRTVDLEPDSVVVKGAEKVLNTISSWPLTARTYSELAMPVVEDVPLLDTLRGVVSLSVTKVKMYIPTEQLAEMLFEEVPIIIREKPDQGEVLLAQKSISILVRGGVNVLANLSPDDFRVQIDYDDLVTDTSGTFIPTIILPAGLHLLKIEPSEVRYSLRK